MTARPDVVLINAYSRRNVGDGLLVDLSADVVRDAMGASTRVGAVAVAPDSFDTGFPDVLAAPASPALGGVQRTLEAAETLVRRRVPGRLHALPPFRISVGGGYLRFGRPGESVKTQVAHLSQVAALRPQVMLPQSIGPLRFAPRRTLGVLRDVPHICARDDRTVDELAGLGNVIRMPDLGVLEVAGRLARQSPRPATDDAVAVVTRDLAGHREFAARLRTLYAGLGARAVPAMQSTAGANNDDREFTRSLTRARSEALANLLDGRRVGVVISMRLHGAVAALIAGVPAIHLSYERKGFGAYQDLGLLPWVHNVHDFDPELVLEQVAQLTAEPTRQHDLVAERVPRLRQQRADLLDLVARAAGG